MPLLTDADVLARLSDALSPGELASTLERLLRLPEGWRALHQADFIEAVGGQVLPAPITAARLAALALGPEVDLRAARLDSGSAAALESVWQRALEGHPPEDLVHAALLGVALLRREGQAEGLRPLLDTVSAHPRAWRSALCISLPASARREEWLSGLLASAAGPGQALAANALLANFPVPAAAELLSRLVPGRAAETAAALRRLGEPALSRSLAERLAHEEAAVRLPAAGTLEGLIQAASLQLANGDSASARKLLERAWESTVDASARIADRLADSAEAEGDALIANHALELALKARPTPGRHARWVHSLAEAGRAEEALAALSPAPASVEGRTAAGWIHLRRGDPERARSEMLDASRDLLAGIDPEPVWFDRLIAGLRDLGEVEAALRIHDIRLRAFPGDLASRLDFVQLLADAREDAQAIDHARLILAISPSSALARRVLAASLAWAGRPAEALPHWQMLASTDASLVPSVIECALGAGEIETARATHEQSLGSTPASAALEVLGAQVEMAAGETDRAIARLHAAAERWSDCDTVWIELARVHQHAGDLAAADAALQAGGRAAPGSPALLHALALRHLEQGRTAEAAEASRRSWEAAPEVAGPALTYSRALMDLGRGEEAVPVLRRAVARHPGLWAARLALAQALEGVGAFSEAAGLFDGRPDPDSVQEARLVGRISVRAAEVEPRPAILERARRMLALVCSQSGADPEALFWLGRTHELVGDSQAALECFRKCLAADTQGRLREKAVVGLARAALAGGDVALAVSTLEEARRDLPGSAPVLGLLSKAYLEAHLEEQALETAEKWLASDAGDEALTNLAHVASRASRWDRAISAYGELAGKRPADAHVWLHLARAHWKSSDSTSARSAAGRGIAIARRDPATLARAADIVAEAGEFRTAQRVLRHAAALAPEATPIWRSLAQISDRLGDSRTSHEAWSHLTALQPGDASAWKGAAAAAWQRGLRAGAVGNWQKALSLAPDDLPLKVTLARALLQNGEPEPALHMYAVARTQDPRDADLALEAGLAEMRFGAPETALVTLAQAAQLDPNRVEPQTAIAECLIRLDRPAEAGDALDLAQRAGGDIAARGHALRALTALAAGDLPASLAAIADARSRPCRTADDASWVARAALALGQWPIALQTLEDRLADKADPSLVVEILTARIRVAGAYWVLATVAGAVRHAPDSSAVGSEARTSFQTWSDRGAQIGIPSAVLESLQDAFAAALGEASPESIARLAAAVEEMRTPEPLHALAVAHLRAQRPQPAVRILESALRRDPWGWTDLLLGLGRAAGGDSGGAREAYTAAHRNPSLRPALDWLAGRATLAAGDPEQAQRAFNSALSAWPDEPAWQAQLASLYLDQGALETALPHLQEAVELAPDHGDYVLVLARALRDAGQLTEAAAAYERVVQAMPKLGSVWKEAAELALAVGDAPRAQRWYERACTLAPSDAGCLMGAARAALALGQLREANDHAQAAQRVAPDDPEVLLGWGEVLAAQGKPEKALQALELAQSQAEDPRPIRLARSRLLIKVGRAGEAVAQLREAVAADADDDQTWAALAEACEAAGDLEAGLEAGGRAVRVAPRKAAHRVLVGRLARSAGQLDRALAELVRAQALSPTDARVAAELGRVHEERREVKRALDAYQRAIELDPAYGPAHFRAGLILKDLKAYPQSGRMLKRAVELNPTDPDALHQLAAVRALELVHGGIPQAAVSS